MNINFNNLSDNFLLSLLSSDEQATISSAVKLVPVNIGEIICEPGAKLEYVYFPISGMFSLLYILENGGSAEIGVIGKEGFVGVPILLGGETMPHQVIIQGSGEAFRMPVYHLTKLFNQSISFRNILLHYMQALMTQISQTAVCNSHHKIDQRLCRWLLLSLDRLSGNELCMTQELISIMLGVRREGITSAASNLQKEKIIDYSRGTICVLDRHKLEERCCECYEVVKKEYSRLFSDL